MPDTTYKRLDYDQTLFLVNLIFQKMKGSPLNTQYTLTANGDDYELRASVDGAASTLIATIPAASASAAGIMSATMVTKLAGIETGAEANVIEVVKVNGTALTPDGTKAVNITIPTAVSAFTNDADYQTGTEVQEAIDDAISGITGFDFEVVQTLPATGEKGVIYLVPNTGSGTNTYDEYIWITSGGSSRFERLGTTDIDLSGYVQASQMATLTNTEITTAVNSAYTAVFGS